MLIVFLILVFGFLTAIRILREFVGQNILTKKQMTNFGTFFFVFVVVNVFFVSNFFLMWVLTFLPHVAFLFFISFLKKYRRKKFEEEFEEILGLIILKMKSGKGFRSAFSEVIFESSTSIQRILIDIRDVVVFSQQNNIDKFSDFTREIISEFVQADVSSHSALKRLVSFRERLKVLSDFRRKSGQVMQQIRIQSLILSGVYLALFVFVVRKFGFETNRQMILTSLLFFGVGMCFVFYRGNKIKWKI